MYTSRVFQVLISLQVSVKAELTTRVHHVLNFIIFVDVLSGHGIMFDVRIVVIFHKFYMQEFLMKIFSEEAI